MKLKLKDETQAEASTKTSRGETCLAAYARHTALVKYFYSASQDGGYLAANGNHYRRIGKVCTPAGGYEGFVRQVYGEFGRSGAIRYGLGEEALGMKI